MEEPNHPPSVTEVLAAHNMRRLLDAYRTLAPLTIGGPASTTLENPTGQINTTRSTTSDAAAAATAPATVPRKLQPYPPWMHGAADRRRHSSSGGAGAGAYLPAMSPRPPVFSARDADSSSLLETTLEGRGISCFSVGGELRLCLTQVLQLVLNAIPLNRIHQACEELQIYCSTCSPTQLATLKLARVLPVSTTQCGLITKSDAERLCSVLQSPAKMSVKSAGVSPPRTADPSAVRVQHSCFGTCVGLLHSKSFNSPSSPCIECEVCGELFSPTKFVCHTHQADRGIVHWGFNRDNWTVYIQVWEDYPDSEKGEAEALLNSLKKKVNNPSKRKLEDSEEASWRKRCEEDAWSKRTDEDGWKRRCNELEKSQTNSVTGVGLPVNPLEKVLFPGIDQRLLFPWSVVPPQPYLQSLAHLHHLRLLLDQHHQHQQQQQQSQQVHPHQQQPGQPLHPHQQIQLRNQLHSGGALSQFQHRPGVESSPVRVDPQRSSTDTKSRDRDPEPAAPAPLADADRVLGRMDGTADEFIVGVAAVLAGAGVGERSRMEVLGVVERLVERLHRAEREKMSAAQQLKDLEERIASLEKELSTCLERSKEDVVQTKLGKDKQEDETSSDGGIESGTEADDFSEK